MDVLGGLGFAGVMIYGLVGLIRLIIRAAKRGYF
jgi:hypothetical protein